MSEPTPYPSSSTSSTNLFPFASGTIVNGGTFIGSYASMLHDDSYEHLEPLYKLVAQNAILNQGGRADEVRCYPGTREEVVAKIEAWRDGGYLLDRFIFWLSGPAGAGKSAIVQTVAERCIKDGVPMINFFFYRADSTRNHVRSLVPTLLFQLFGIFPSLKTHIRTIIRENPVIFDASMTNQFRMLVIDPILHLRRGSSSSENILLLIDGLDECDSRADHCALLRILHELSNLPGAPFIVLIASRTESQIVMAFNSLQTFRGSIFLDHAYRPEEDIRLYVRGELDRISRTHPLCDTLGHEWPSDDDVNSIARKSSGQFIYAATVVRFVSNPSKGPHASLQTVLGIRPAGKSTPFAEIDALYTHILSQVDDWDVVRDVLALNAMFWNSEEVKTIELLGYNIADIQSSFLALAPILCVDARKLLMGSFSLHFYHLSFNNFLYDWTRAGSFYIDIEAVATQMIQKIISDICNMGKNHVELEVEDVLPLLHLPLAFVITTPTTELTATLQQISLATGLSRIHCHKNRGICRNILSSIESIYTRSDTAADAYELIIRSWTAWFHQIGLPLSEVPEWHWTIISSGLLTPSPVQVTAKTTASNGKRRFRCSKSDNPWLSSDCGAGSKLYHTSL